MDFDQQKFLELVQQIAVDNRITQEEVIEIVKNSFVDIWKAGYGDAYDVDIEIKNNNLQIYRKLKVVENVEDVYKEIKGQNIGEIIREPVSSGFSRAMMSELKNRIKHNITILHKQKEYDQYITQVNMLLSCVVKKNYVKFIVVSVGGLYEGIIPTSNMVSTERFQQGDKILCNLKQVRYNLQDYQLVFDRQSNVFIENILKHFIPEIENNTIEIVSIAREPGSICKILVTSHASVNSIGCCLGFNGQRKKNIESELKGEKVDFILYSPVITECIKNFFKSKIEYILDIIIDQKEEKHLIITEEEHVGLLIGKNGQNIKLINKLLGLKFNVMSNKAFADQKNQEQKVVIDDLINLGMNEDSAQNIIKKYSNLQEAFSDPYVTAEDLTIIKTYINNQNMKLHEEFLNRGGSQDLLDRLKILPSFILEKIMDLNLLTLEDLTKNFATSQDLSSVTGIEPQFCAIIMGHSW